MKIITETKNLKEVAGNALNEMVVSRGDKPLLLLLSGGSSLELLNFIQPESLKGGITVGMLDDRYSYDGDVNNYLVLQGEEFPSNFVINLLNSGSVFLNSAPGEHEDLETYAARYEAYIQDWLSLYPDGIIRATVGIGPDGHTSGVLPHPENVAKFNILFNDPKKLVVGYDVENKNIHRYRMTSTFTLMRKFDEVLTFMTGENKRRALQKVVAEEGSLPETPGRIIRELKNVTVFTDILV